MEGPTSKYSGEEGKLRMVGMFTCEAIVRGDGKQDAAEEEEKTVKEGVVNKMLETTWQSTYQH